MVANHEGGRHQGRVNQNGPPEAVLGALEPVDLFFKPGNPLVPLGQGTWRIRDPINLGHQPFNQHIRLKKGH